MLDNAVYIIGENWSNTQINARRILRQTDNVRNSGRSVLNEPGSGVVPHYPLPQSRFLSFLQRLRIARHGTIAGHRRQRHHWSIVLLWEPHLPSLGWRGLCVPRPLSSPNNSACADLQGWWCRSGFFMPDKGEQFVHFHFLNLFRQGHFRNSGGVGLDPQRHGAVMNP